MSPGEIHNLRDFGLGDLVTEHTDHSQPLLVNSEHDFKGLRVIQTKKALKHQYHELHRREVVIQQQHLV